MRIALTGASGLLGSAISELAASKGIQCVAVPRTLLKFGNEGQLHDILAMVDVVIHAAANTNVEQCEREPDGCYADNYLLSEALARVANRTNTKVAFISSTGVYGGWKETEAYREYDAVAPTTHHHRSKVLAENAVLAQDPENLVIRTGWLFGGNYDNPKNFVARRIDEAKKALATGSLISSNNEQRGSPSFNVDVATRILELTARRSSGIFNCVNEGHASRLDYVRAIVTAARLNVDVIPAAAAAFNRAARVSNNETAANWKMSQRGLPRMPSWDISLSNYVSKVVS